MPQDAPRSDDLPKIPIDAIPDGYVPTGVREEGASDPPAFKRIEVRIRHGDLAFASYPVVIGHYDGDLIVSAESALDNHLDGLLKARHESGIYPGPLQTCAIVFNPVPERAPRGGVIIGLGRAGRLEPGTLTKTLTRAVIEYCSAYGERHCQSDEEQQNVKRQEVGLSCLLVGTGEGGLSLREAAYSMVLGFIEANRSMSKTDKNSAGRKAPLITNVEFVELYEDLANEAIRTLMDVKRAEDVASFIKVETTLATLPGGLRRLVRTPDQRWWRRLEIRDANKTTSGGAEETTKPPVDSTAADGKDRSSSPQGATLQVSESYGAEDDYAKLEFLALTDRARIPRHVAISQVSLVEELIHSSISRTLWDKKLSRALFELLIPNPLKASLSDGRDLELILDEDSAAYPWELLEDPRGGGRPLGVEKGIVRRLITDPIVHNPETTRSNTALVVGNPQAGNPRFPTLPGATSEAVAVTQILDDSSEDGFKVVHSIGTAQKAIVKAMFGHPLAADGFHIVHFAGHGVYSPDGKSGMVVGPRGQVLGANEIACMPTVPELVFLNCCHLGRIGGVTGTLSTQEANRLAANLGIAFIRRGAHAVIAAGWAVNDQAAEDFAVEFYRQLIHERQVFGEAVKRARSYVFRTCGDTNTWGAYQCYGDHSFHLRRRKGGAKQIASSETNYMRSWHSPREPVQELYNLSQVADTAACIDCGLKTKLDSLERSIRETRKDGHAWLQSNASVRGALGHAWGQLGEFDRAAEHLRAALKLEDAGLPLRYVEMLANFEARAACFAWRTQHEGDLRSNATTGSTAPGASSGKKARTPVTRIKAVLARLEVLNDWGETAERNSLRGSAFKRLAAITAEGNARARYLGDACEAYGRAFHLAQESGGYLVYAASNLLSCLLLLKARGEKPRGPAPDFQAVYKRAMKAAKEREDSQPSFFSKIAIAELAMLRSLHSGQRPSAEILMRDYDAAWRRGGSYRALSSLCEHFWCCLRILPDRASNKKSKAWYEKMIETLRKIHDKLNGILLDDSGKTNGSDNAGEQS